MLDAINRYNVFMETIFLENRHDIYVSLIYWNSLLDSLRPDVVVYNTPPHVIYDQILYSLCHEKGIKTIVFEQEPYFHPYCMRMLDYKIGDLSVKKKYESLRGSSQSVAFSKPVADLYQKLTTTTQNYLATTVYGSVAKTRVKRSLREKFKEIRDIYDRFRDSSARKTIESIQALDESSLETFENKELLLHPKKWRHRWPLYYGKLFLHRERLEKLCAYYRKKTTKPEQDEPFVLFPLASQPERTSNPQGGLFTFQLLAVNMLSNALPRGWKVYVKEHYSQFFPFRLAGHYRSREFYDACSHFANVRLIACDHPTNELIRSARAVATLSGTTGYEALACGIPVIAFGYPWYRYCHGVFKVDNFADVKNALLEISKGIDVTGNDFKLFLTAIERSAVMATVGDFTCEEVGVDMKQNIAALANGIATLAGISTK